MRNWLLRATNKGLSNDDLENAANSGIDLSSRTVSLSLRKEKRAMATGAGLNVFDFGQEFDRALKLYGNVLNVVKKLPTPNGITLNTPSRHRRHRQRRRDRGRSRFDSGDA